MSSIRGNLTITCHKERQPCKWMNEIKTVVFSAHGYSWHLPKISPCWKRKCYGKVLHWPGTSCWANQRAGWFSAVGCPVPQLSHRLWRLPRQILTHLRTMANVSAVVRAPRSHPIGSAAGFSTAELWDPFCLSYSFQSTQHPLEETTVCELRKLRHKAAKQLMSKRWV